jgi:hypothetical protein
MMRGDNNVIVAAVSRASLRAERGHSDTRAGCGGRVIEINQLALTKP